MREANLDFLRCQVPQVTWEIKDLVDILPREVSGDLVESWTIGRRKDHDLTFFGEERT